MRCGDLSAAQEAVEETGDAASSAQFRQIFAVYVKTSEDGNGAAVRLPDAQWTQAVQVCREQGRRSRDRFEHAVYQIIARIKPPAGIPVVSSSIEDFAWLKLSHVQCRPDTLPAALRQMEFTLADFQKVFDEYGPEHFDPTGGAPMTYFRLLLLSQRFVDAIKHLGAAGAAGYQVEAVHFAIALDYFGLLPDSVDMVRLLRQYAARFARTDPGDALEYLVLLRDPAERERAVKDLVLETREFQALLGDINVVCFPCSEWPASLDSHCFLVYLHRTSYSACRCRARLRLCL
jgi:Nup93/Nic96 protein